MSSLAAGTIVAKPYLSLARVLAQSFRTHHPQIPFFALLADEVDGFFDPAEEPFQLVGLSGIAIPHPERFCFRYTQQPFSYALTPYFLQHLLERGFERVIFFKQEGLVTGDHAPVFELLERHPIVLTPHLLEPLVGSDAPGRELNILQSGVFNIGMLGVSESPTSHRFLEWWQDRVYDHCRHAVAEGMHYEQRWIDLAPALFEGVLVLRDPGGNVGHWNLPERSGVAGRLFRFSGFDPDDPAWPTRHSRRVSMEEIGPAAAMFARYASMLDDAGYQTTRHWPYAFASFDNGVPIPDVARQIYLTLGDAVEELGDPFRTAEPSSYFHWLNHSIDGSLSRLWNAVYQQRPDVQRAFPDVSGLHRHAFLEWIVCSGLREHSIAESFAPNRMVPT